MRTPVRVCIKASREMVVGDQTGEVQHKDAKSFPARVAASCRTTVWVSSQGVVRSVNGVRRAPSTHTTRDTHLSRVANNSRSPGDFQGHRCHNNASAVACRNRHRMFHSSVLVDLLTPTNLTSLAAFYGVCFCIRSCHEHAEYATCFPVKSRMIVYGEYEWQQHQGWTTRWILQMDACSHSAVRLVFFEKHPSVQSLSSDLKVCCAVFRFCHEPLSSPFGLWLYHNAECYAIHDVTPDAK